MTSDIPQNPSQMRARMIEIILEDERFGDQEFSKALLLEALDEVIGSIIDAYVNQAQPSACQKIVGQLFLSKL